MDELIRYLKALVVLQAAIMDGKSGDHAAPEVLLRRAGLDIQEISDLLGKSYAATAKTISRDKSARSRRPTSTTK
jgi:hypothetical protein